jgi:hypothetical protein
MAHRDQQLGETAEQLAARLDRMYLALAGMYQRLGRILGIQRGAWRQHSRNRVARDARSRRP